MKRIGYIIGLVITFYSVGAQITNPIKWQSKIEKKSATEYVLTFEATIEKDWHLYSQFTPKGGPAPLEISFPDSKGKYQPIGKATESPTVTAYNKVFGVNETFFIEKARIRQVVKVSNHSVSRLRATLTYQICKQVCIPQEVNFEFDIKSLQAKEIRRKIR